MGAPRVSRRSVQFFLDWIDARVKLLQTLEGIDEPERAALLAEQADGAEIFRGTAREGECGVSWESCVASLAPARRGSRLFW